MHLMQVFLVLLVSAVAAIDVFLSPHFDCSGPGVGCWGLQPDICCHLITIDITYMNMKVARVPGDWHIVMQGFKEINCKDRYTDRTSGEHKFLGYRDYCFDAAWGREGFQSARYQFLSGKRENAPAEAEPAGNCSLPNALSLDGGIAYSLDGLDEGARAQTFKMVAENAPQAAIDKFNLT